MENRNLLTVDEAARLLSISRWRVYRLAGVEIPAVRIGRSVRFQIREIERFVATHTENLNCGKIAAPLGGRPNHRKTKEMTGDQD